MSGFNKDDLVFGLDIGTRNVVGTVGYLEDKEFTVLAQSTREHQTRAMLDGQIHDIGRVGSTVMDVKAELENQIEMPLDKVCIAAAGRVLRTITVHIDYEYPEETVVSGEDMHTLDMMGIEEARRQLDEAEQKKYKFFCVGYTTVKYYLNGDPFGNILEHKAEVIGEDIIVTFLPEDVVDGLYAAVGKAGLGVANLTLEPIAAINIAIPENFRMLNIALIDVGAGTSDICITRDGSIIAYGMIPMAGDELTEVLVQSYLCDFATAEKIKLESTTEKEITFEDIMSITHTVKAEDVWALTDPVMEKITTAVAEKIIELNGDKTVSAAFVVGGGGKVHGFTESLAKKLDIIKERVALRGEEVMKNITFEQPEIKKDPLLVTPVGICLNYYEQRNSFIMISFNGNPMKLYDNGKLTIVDAAMQAGFSAEELFPRRGKEIHYTVNGVSRMIRGTEGESAVATLNGRTVGVMTPLEFNADVTLTPSTVGEGAISTIEDLEEYTSATIAFNVCGKRVVCPKFVEVNGSMESGSYKICDGDVIENRNYYTVSQIAEFMDVKVDDRFEILVNNRPASEESLVYENFSVDWTLKDGISELDNYEAYDEEVDGDSNDENSDSAKIIELPVGYTKVKAELLEVPVIVNGQEMTLSGKSEYLFCDIFTLIDFDVNEANGRFPVTKINGMECGYADPVSAGDKVEIYWSEKASV